MAEETAKQSKLKVLFVCTQNAFRSMSAEYLAKKHAEDNQISDIEFSSAGTVASPQYPYQETVQRLKHYGVEVWNHRQRKLDVDMLEENDIVICMTRRHKRGVELLGYKAYLLNEIAYGKDTDLMDDVESGKLSDSYEALESFIHQTVDYIHDAMPYVIKNIMTRMNERRQR